MGIKKSDAELGFLNLLSEAIFIYCEDSIVLANDRALKLCCVEKIEDIIDKPINGGVFKVHPDYKESAEEGIKELLKGSCVPPVEQKLIRNDGSILEAEVAGSPYIYKGKPASMIIVRDLTEVKKAESRLRETERFLNESERRYEKLLHISPNGIFTYCDNIIIFANSAAAELVGVRSADMLIGKDISKLFSIHPESREVGLKRYNEFQKPGVTLKHFEQKLIRQDGAIIEVEVVGNSYIEDGKLCKFITAKDITERKQNEINRIKLAETLEYDRLKTEFFANLSHELRTPLNIILGTIQLINSISLDNELCPYHNRFLKYITTMKQNCYRLLRLINNLIDITKMDVGCLKMNYSNYDIVKIVEDITLSVVDYIESKNINIIFDTDVEEQILACDADKMERVILNLLSNSIKFTKPGGDIFVNIYSEENSLFISVKDTGIGIPENMVEKIFDRFRQVDDLFTRTKEGSGIGLSLVRAIVEDHGGKVTATSKYGKGSEFIIELPKRVFGETEESKFVTKSITDNVERINIEFSDIYS